MPKHQQTLSYIVISNASLNRLQYSFSEGQDATIPGKTQLSFQILTTTAIFHPDVVCGIQLHRLYHCLTPKILPYNCHESEYAYIFTYLQYLIGRTLLHSLSESFILYIFPQFELSHGWLLGFALKRDLLSNIVCSIRVMESC